jgi:hypothetical protein
MGIAEFDDGWIARYGESGPLTDAHAGKVCAIGLADGRLLVKVPQRGADGVWRLHGNRPDDVPLPGAIAWAADADALRPGWGYPELA